MLVDGDLRATFLPDLGMLGASLRYRGEELLALPGGLAAYRKGKVVGLPLLAPWANRLAAWAYEVAGVRVDLDGLTLVDDGAGLPIHGTMTAQRGWKVDLLGQAALRADFDAASRPELMAAFPFPHQMAIEATVAGGSLSVTTTIRATGDRAVPVSFGWHPYFRLPHGRRSAWRLHLPECRHLQLDERGLPTGDSLPLAREAERLGGRIFDDLYVLGDDRRLAIESGGWAIDIELQEGYPYAQVYAPEGGRFVCLEPMTAPTNALITGPYELVPPGRSFSATFRVTPRA